jgi:hypothetical protein
MGVDLAVITRPRLAFPSRLASHFVGLAPAKNSKRLARPTRSSPTLYRSYIMIHLPRGLFYVPPIFSRNLLSQFRLFPLNSTAGMPASRLAFDVPMVGTMLVFNLAV